MVDSFFFLSGGSGDYWLWKILLEIWFLTKLKRYHVIHVFDITFWCKIIIFVVGEWLLVDFGNVLFCNFVHCSLSLVDSVVTCNHFFLLLKLWFILVKWCWFLIKLFWYVTELQWNGFSSFNDIFKFLPVLVSSLAQKLGRRKCEPPVYGLSGHNYSSYYRTLT